MKRVFILLCSVVVMMAGCGEAPDLINESGEVTATTATTTTTITTEPPVTAETEQETEKETYEYKGVVFEGWYSSGTYPGGGEYDNFHIDTDFILEGGGQNLYEISYSVTLAYIAFDDVKLLEYFDDEYIEQQFNGMNRYRTSKIEHLVSLNLNNLYVIDVKNDPTFVVLYIAIFDYDDDYSLWVSMDMYLNSNNQWNLKYIDYTP